jgi:hypothetical protein
MKKEGRVKCVLIIDFGIMTMMTQIIIIIIISNSSSIPTYVYMTVLLCGTQQ